MELKIMSLDGTDAGSVELSDAIFGLEPRADILHRCVRWQLAKRQRGTHDVKNRAEISRTGKKMYRQKGTGSARHGNKAAPQFRGGGKAFGPVSRSHAIELGAISGGSEERAQRACVAAGAQHLFEAHEERADRISWLRRDGQGPPRRHDDEEPCAGSHGEVPRPRLALDVTD